MARSKRWRLGPPSADHRPKSYRTGTNSPEEAVPFLSLLPPSEPQLGLPARFAERSDNLLISRRILC
jgi:hypothetical protein